MDETVKGILAIVVAVLIFIGILFVCGMIATSCETQRVSYRQSLPTYRVRYSSFLNGSASYDFETYTVDGPRYTFYDKNGALVADILVSGDSRLIIERNHK